MLQVVQLNGTTSEFVVEDCGQDPVGHLVQDPTSLFQGKYQSYPVVAARPFVDGVDENPFGTQQLGPVYVIPAHPAPPPPVD